VDNISGRVTLSYDFSSTPVTVMTDTNFFGFLFEPVVVGVVDPSTIYMIPDGIEPFMQHPESSAQYCITQTSDRTGLQCSNVPGSDVPVPEPGSWFLLGSGLTFLGVFGQRFHVRQSSAPLRALALAGRQEFPSLALHTQIVSD